jgi:hypothetical protein
MGRAPVDSPALCMLTGEPGLSLAAKGLAALVLTRPPRPISMAELFRISSDPWPMIRGAVKELADAGMVNVIPPKRRGERASGAIILRQL